MKFGLGVGLVCGYKSVFSFFGVILKDSGEGRLFKSIVLGSAFVYLFCE